MNLSNIKTYPLCLFLKRLVLSFGIQFILMTGTPTFTLAQQTSQQADSIAMYFDIEDVIVTAQYAPTSSKNALQNIRTISRATIEAQGANNLEQLLQQDLNIRISQDLVLGSSMSLLGVEGENVKIMIDGVPVVGRLSGNIDLGQINLNNIERIEIIEGPMSVSYGTDALGGVINLITKKSQRSKFELNLSQQIESRAEQSTRLDAGAYLGEQLLVRVNGGRDYFKGFSEEEGRSVLWNPKEQWYGDASLRYDFGEDHRVQYQLSYFDEQVQNLGNVRRPQFKPYAFDDFFGTQRLNHALSHEGSVFKNFYWQNTLGYNDFNRTVDSYRLNFLEDEANEEILLASDTTLFDSYMLRSVFASKFADAKLNFQVGIDLRYDEGSGVRLLDPADPTAIVVDLSEYAAFGSLRFTLIDAISMEAGLRLSENSRYDVPLIPSFNLKYSPSEELDLRFSYGKGFRSPGLKELFLNFIDISHYIIGNPLLDAETADNYQFNLSWNKRFKKLSFQSRLHLFHNEIINQIQLFPFLEIDGEIVPTTPDQSIQYAYFNMARGITKGANLRMQVKWEDISMEAGISSIGFFNPLSDEIGTVDRFTYTTELSGKLGYQIPWTKTQINIFSRFNDRFINYYPVIIDGEEVARQRIQDGFVMLDATLSQNFLKNRITLTAGVRNLLNTTQLNVSGGSVGAHSSGGGLPVGAGRSFFVQSNFRIIQSKDP